MCRCMKIVEASAKYERDFKCLAYTAAQSNPPGSEKLTDIRSFSNPQPHTGQLLYVYWVASGLKTLEIDLLEGEYSIAIS